ncbi:hypothetical protein U9K52_12945 [Chryseobacterium sp. MHB01]|uniref:hypothetical protein n=1 Tax=Chryseobacterium sp. MHB01 TaxID=3109433 RepID=UPI002AFFCD62|nr:hypothetical protein [Chryseobacterium sp. MHB01]MEA1849825.1 hypothetical protein [Chryseobacterium sp. MHB01]
MKNLFKVFCILAVLAIICSLESCGDLNKKKNPNNKFMPSPDLVKIPAELATVMKKNFDSCPYNVLKKIVTSHPKDYYITNEQFTNIYNNFPQKSETLKIHFIQYRKEQNYNNNYPELIPFDKQLYIVYSYAENGSIEKYHGIFNLEKDIYISQEDFEKMKNNYKEYIKKEIGRFNCIPEQEQTDYVNIKKQEIKDYLIDVQKYELSNAVKGNIVKFILSTVSDMDKYKNYYQKKNDDAKPGQLTLITDTWADNNSSSRISLLSDYDLNTLCPSNCDAK